MAISLSKGQTISLKKESAGLKRVHMGVGWDPIAPKGFFAKLTGPKDIDLDASLVMFNAAKERVCLLYTSPSPRDRG